MYLKIRDVDKIVNLFAPKELKESYDNIGLMVGNQDSYVTTILFSLDCTMDVIDEAIANRCNLIFTHHPLMFKKPKNITSDTLLGLKIIKLVKNDINVYSAHTNLDSTSGGINDILVRLLGYNKSSVINVNLSSTNISEDIGIGRLVNVPNGIRLSELCQNVKRVLKLKNIRYSGNENKIIKKLAIINGSGEDYFLKAVSLKADCILTGDTTYHHVSDMNEIGVGVIDAGHFDTEWPCFQIYASMFEKEITNMDYENKVLISCMNKNPYKFG